MWNESTRELPTEGGGRKGDAMNTSPLRIVRKQYQTVIRGQIWGSV
jgi:hypothetical protein